MIETGGATGLRHPIMRRFVMPIYEYDCQECGIFTRLAKISESSMPAPCPECGEESPRIISAPSLALMTQDNRQRWERNEKAQHAPRLARRSSCGCTGSHTCGAGKKSAAQKSESSEATPKFQRQTKKTARPWMLGH